MQFRRLNYLPSITSFLFIYFFIWNDLLFETADSLFYIRKKEKKKLEKKSFRDQSEINCVFLRKKSVIVWISDKNLVSA